MRLPAFKPKDKIGPFLILAATDKRSYQGSIIWECLCDCGEKCELYSTQIEYNSHRSCHKEIPKRVRVTHDAKLGRRLTKYKDSAKRRKLDFHLSIQEFENLLKGSCFYCGSNGFMGIDRKDSKSGYLLENCVSCCQPCNRAKSDMSMEDFLKYLKRLALFVMRQS
jgi:hypothetical protein